MKIRHLILILGVCFPAIAHAQLPDQALKCFQWFSTLGYPDVKEARWAEIWTGSWSSSGGEDKPKAHTIQGFITKDSKAEFFVVRTDLFSSKLKKSKPDTPSHERVGFEERPFLKMVEQQLEALRHPPKDSWHRFGAKLGLKAEVFFLAYVCWQRGEEDLAAQLYAEAQKLTPFRSQTREPGQMQEDLEKDLGHAAMWDAVLRCGGGSLGWHDWGSSGKLEPRTDLLKAFRRVVQLFPHCEHVERAKQSADMLERMIQEDKINPPLTQKEIDQLPLDKRVAKLVWMLRDQNGHQWSQPGWCDVFSMEEKGTSPAHQLLAIGYPAAPALIEALNDERFSRSVGFHRNFHFSHTILTVGDCAQQILSRMSGQNFYSPASTSGYMSNEEKMLEVQKAARKWWEEYQKKGKKQMLVDSIAAGKTSPYALVQQLQAEAPAAVEDALLRGIEKAQNPWMRRQFIQQLGALKSPAATEKLFKLMEKDKSQEVRLEAAGRLLNLEHPRVLPAILHEWDILPAGDDSSERRENFEEKVGLLIATGDEQAMRALADHWDDRPVSERFEIVNKLGEGLDAARKEYVFSSLKVRPVSSGAKEAAIELLAHALEDRDTRDGYSGSNGDFRFNNPPICDFALWALHKIDGDKYAFTPKADRRQRDAEQLAAANVWRKEHQKPLLQPPPPRPALAEKDALKIVTVQITPATGFEDIPLIKQALALRDSPFGPKTISALLIRFASEEAPGIRGLRIKAVRENDLTGVELHLRIEPGDYPARDGPGWSTGHSGTIGTKNLSSSGGSSSFSGAGKADAWDDFEEELTQALESPPTTAFTFSAGLKASR
ncbi:HEAT repeat domain-containing protein [Prosthecobacter sp.]|uniref:HEAT repeat domain-containing protein n=1 Tax=Prosthecobacter sp. TaxID=1965333 RepID=UPI003782FEC4